MKKLMLMVAMMMLAVAVMAAGTVVFDGAVRNQVQKLSDAKNYAEARAVIATVDASDVSAKSWSIQTLMILDLQTGTKLANLGEVKASVAKYASQYGLTDASAIQDLTLKGMYYASPISHNAGITASDAYAFYKSIVAPTLEQKMYGMYLAYRNDDIANAVILGESLANPPYFYMAKSTKGLPVKCFEYSRKALLGKPATATVVVEILNVLAELDFSDTTVTKAMQIDFLQSINAKYSRFLITDKATWEPVIANVRTTLEGYGVK